MINHPKPLNGNWNSDINCMLFAVNKLFFDTAFELVKFYIMSLPVINLPFWIGINEVPPLRHNVCIQ